MNLIFLLVAKANFPKVQVDDVFKLVIKISTVTFI